ncbi:MAG: aldehyde dehydrogenase family protein [Chloroflexota bacterium]
MLPTPALSASVTEFLRERPKKLLIDGQWVASASGATFTTINPASGEVIAEVAEADDVDVDRAVHAARVAFEGPWAKVRPNERAKLLWRLADLLEQNIEELAQIETIDGGKPVREGLRVDIPMSAEILRYYAGWPTKIFGETVPISAPGNWHAYTRREPLGVCGAIIPWNMPIFLTIWKLGPALATGNTVVLKPAEWTPLTAIRIGELITEAGFPDGVVNIIQGEGATTGAALVRHPGVDKIAFTGSTATGQAIMRECANDIKKVSLELGGKSPNIIFADADLDQAVKGAANGIFFNNGQTCIAGSRIFVEEPVYEEVLERLGAWAKQIRLGQPLDAQTQMGPIISERQLNRVLGYVESGVREGARVVAGAERAAGDLADGFFIRPTVFADVQDEMTIAREEIFGPVAASLSFRDLDEVIARGNRTGYGLGAGIWTRDISKAHRAANAMQAGSVWVNCYGLTDAAMPFGGYKQSGIGRELGKQSLDLYTQQKSVFVNLGH